MPKNVESQTRKKIPTKEDISFKNVLITAKKKKESLIPTFRPHSSKPSDWH